VVFVFGSFRLDVANASLRRGKQAVFLTPKVHNVLRYLVEHAGQLVTKDDLWRAVWPGVSVTDATLTVCVNRIRKALGDEPKTPRYIETVHRLGYRFIAPVSTQSVRILGSEVPRQDLVLARSPQSLTPHFVGREAELAQLHKWLELAVGGERQIVFVTGEPGIGKTTLVEEFLLQEQVAREGSLWIGRGQCIWHYGIGEAYFPILDALERLCRMPGGERLVELLNKEATTWLAQMPALLGAAERRKLERKVAGATRARMLRELADAMEVISQERPLVLRLEDLHWSDYSTLDCLGFLARRQEPARLLVLGTYRPVDVIIREHPLKHLKHELQIHSQCEELPLALLTESAVMEYLTQRFPSRFGSNLTSGEHQSEGVVLEPLRQLAHTVYQRTDGNPLFMVNMVDYLVEYQVPKTPGDTGTAQSAVALGTELIDMPTNIVQMIEHNLERLKPDEQAVLETASVVGTEFAVAAVAAALERRISEIEACCTRLSRRLQFVQSHGTEEWPDGTVAARFQFLHTLYSDVLYDRVSPARRVELHRRIAEHEETAWGERAPEIATELAHHYSEAGQIEPAIRYWSIAGRRSLKRSANVEAIAQLRTAIELAATLPASADRLRERVRLQVTLISAVTATKGYAAPEVESACNLALELCQEIPDSLELFAVLGALRSVYFNRGQLKISMEIAQRMLCLAEQSNNRSMLLWAHYSFGFILLHKADYIRAREHLENCLGLYDRRQGGSYPFVQDPGPTALIALATAVYFLGYPDLALRRTSEAVELAREISHPFTLAWTLIYAGEILIRLGDEQRAGASLEESVVLCSKHDLTELLAEAITRQGWQLVERGRTEEAIVRLREGIETSNIKVNEAVGRAVLALALSRKGELDEALVLIEETLTREAEGEMRMRLPWLYQVKGELLLMRNSPAEAEASFREAGSVARAQYDKTQELTATTCLARLLARRGRREEACTLLAEIYNQFTEGFDTTDLREAKLLLDGLSH
jgi:predicted ATPase/DNA-binding winged helix-turn-helix (wHTH) protein